MTTENDQTPVENDDRLVIPLDPETALQALLKVDPDEMLDDDDQPRVGSR
jgi:hypothetical protein